MEVALCLAAKPLTVCSWRQPLGQFTTGSFMQKTAPWGEFGVAHSSPPCASTIDRQIDNPIPKPVDLVV